MGVVVALKVAEIDSVGLLGRPKRSYWFIEITVIAAYIAFRLMPPSHAKSLGIRQIGRNLRWLVKRQMRLEYHYDGN